MLGDLTEARDEPPVEQHTGARPDVGCLCARRSGVGPVPLDQAIAEPQVVALAHGWTGLGDPLEPERYAGGMQLRRPLDEPAGAREPRGQELDRLFRPDGPRASAGQARVEKRVLPVGVPERPEVAGDEGVVQKPRNLPGGEGTGRRGAHGFLPQAIFAQAGMTSSPSARYSSASRCTAARIFLRVAGSCRPAQQRAELVLVGEAVGVGTRGPHIEHLHAGGDPGRVEQRLHEPGGDPSRQQTVGLRLLAPAGTLQGLEGLGAGCRIAHGAGQKPSSFSSGGSGSRAEKMSSSASALVSLWTE